MLTPQERIELAAGYVAQGAIIQHEWRRQDESGREYVCALAAFGPDINSSEDCPADLMPQWLARLVPALDDGIAPEDVPWFGGGLVERARQWNTLTPERWEHIRIKFLIACINQAVQAAEAAGAAAEWAGAAAEAAEWAAEWAAGAAAEWAAEWAAGAAAEWAGAAAAWKRLAAALFAAIDEELFSSH